MTAQPPAPDFATRVRMYRQGLGDCFLISFLAPSPVDPFHILIDCGLIQGAPGAKERMRAVVADIRKTTQGCVNVVVITHEHWDHLSGFLDALPEFEKLGCGELWLAWTENLRDPDARALRDMQDQALEVVHAAAERLQGLKGRRALAAHALGRDIGEMMGFFGLAPGERMPAQGSMPAGESALRSRTAQALNVARELAGNRVRYLEPGALLDSLGGMAGLRAFTLGPPRNRELLFKSDPSRKHPEVYELAAAGASVQSLWAGLQPATDLKTDWKMRAAVAAEQPFAKEYRLTPNPKAARSKWPQAWFAKKYNGSSAWRAIDNDWLQAAGNLALKLDADTNNTSLVLAFELSPGGPVLLFPGDAQVGNWLSWQTVKWADAPTITACDLLRRTVVDKVGHHGSHNATLREHGLEAMVSPDLTALLPVHVEMARKKRWNQMPLPSLVERLREKTQHRLLVADELSPQAPPLPSPRWQAFVENRVKYSEQRFPGTDEPLFVEFKVGSF